MSARFLSLIVWIMLSISSTSIYAIAPPLNNQQKQMWNLQDADIRAVIQTISQLVGKNFIIDPRVQGKVTLVSAKPMTVDEMYKVFLSLLQVLNYAAIPSGNVIKIVPSMDAKGHGGILRSDKNPGTGDQVVMRVVPINNVSAEQLVSIVRPLMLDWGSVSAYQPSNSLILAGAAANVNQVVAVIHNLDNTNSPVSEIVHLKYADANKLAQVLQGLQSANNAQGKVNNLSVIAAADENALLISGNRVNRAKAVALIQQLDTAANTVSNNNTSVLRLNYLTAEKLAPMLTKLANGYVEQEKKKMSANMAAFGIGTSDNSPVSIQAIQDANVIVMSGPHQIIESLESVVRKVDVRPQEVLVQAIIVKMDENALNDLGIQWGMLNRDAGSKAFAALPGFQAGLGFLHAQDFRAIISAIKNNANTEILATPSILVLNNQKATISDGKNVGMLNREYSTNTGNPSTGSTIPFNTYDRRDVTLSLEVTPQIAPDNTVRLKIQQKNDSLAQDTQNTGTDNNPVLNTSKIDTAVLVNSGDVLVLGGLISNNDTSAVQKVPLLGDIPGLGQIFRHKTHTVEKKNLMVFIKPIIINNKSDAETESMKSYDYIRYQQMRKQNGMGLANPNPVLPYRPTENPANLPEPFDTGGDK